jgi:hypothetical protein
MTSTDIVSQNGTEAIGLSTIKGTGTKYSDFTWQQILRALMAQLTMDNLFRLLNSAYSAYSCEQHNTNNCHRGMQ